MATLEDELGTKLAATSTITSYVGSDIYFCDRAELLETDNIRYQIISPSNDPVEFGDTYTAQPTVQIDAFSKDASRALAIGNAVVSALHGFRGTLATSIVVTLSTADGPIVSKDASDEQWYHAIVYWTVEYTR